jgi:hypothetical protein
MKPLPDLQLKREEGILGNTARTPIKLKNSLQMQCLLKVSGEVQKLTQHPMLSTFPLETSCLVIQHIVEGALRDKPLQDTCVKLGNSLLQSWEIIKLQGTGHLRNLEIRKKLRLAGSGKKHLDASYLHWANGQPLLEIEEQVQLAALLINTCLPLVPGVFRYQDTTRKRMWRLAVTSQVEELEANLKTALELYNVTKTAMICPPQEWTENNLQAGGYLSTRLQYPLREKGTVPTPWIAAVNKLQNTSWTVSSSFYRTVLEQELTGPEKLFLKEATQFLDKSCWFPYHIDRTGRYIGASKLHPQRSKFAKALMSFHKQHKISEQGRQAQREALARAVGTPLAYLPSDQYLEQNWRETKEPWIVLRLLHELKLDYTGYPLSVDGTCNAVQHYAALLRCEETGRLVGMVDDIERNLYTVIATKLGLERDYVKSVIVPYLFHKTPGTMIYERMALNRETYQQAKNTVQSIIAILEELAPATVKGRNLLTLAYSSSDFRTPLGFSPYSSYTKTQKVRVPVRLGEYTRVTLNKNSTKPDNCKRTRATAPNIIASLAAEHATRTILLFPGDLRYIYDDFGVHPNKVVAIKKLLGETLYAQYTSYEQPNALWTLRSLRNRKFMFR